MKRHWTTIATVLMISLSLCAAAEAAQANRNSKIYNFCTDNYAQLSGGCMMYPTDSALYQMCLGNASASAQYTCQDYRVPRNYEGTFFDNLELSRYPKVGPATAPRQGMAPVADKATLLGTIFSGLGSSTPQ